MLQSVREVIVSIHTKFELSKCLVCPTIEINICSITLIKNLAREDTTLTFSLKELLKFLDARL